MPTIFKKTYSQKILTIFFLLLLFFGLMEKINLKNGEVILKTFSVPKINLYSYTYSTKETIYHHWLTGVVFYLIYQLVGFVGLHFFYLLILVSAVVFGFVKEGSFFSKIFSFLIVLPLLISRREIRPEGFSFLFFSLDLLLIDFYQKKKITFKPFALFYLFINLLWVNLHIFFIFSQILLIIFIFSRLIIDKKLDKKIIFLFLLSVLISFINPYFLRGVVEPLLIFKDYGYPLAENQGLFFMINRFGDLKYIYFLIVILLFLFTLIDKQILKKNIFAIIVSLFFSVASIKQNRLIPFLGLTYFYFFIDYLSFYKKEIFRKMILIPFFFGIFFSLGFLFSYFLLYKQTIGLGFLDNINASAEFVKKNHIQGLIFNNYDIGSYLIFHFYPTEKVFVDNRPEAYTTQFFQQYIKAQENNEVWQKLDNRYHFNLIYFYRHDLTPWGQNFLVNRIKDDQWVPIYVDNYVIIFIKKDKKNQRIIKKYRLPKEMFNVVKI